jgi:exodeoxyribonuclease-3
MRIITYNVNGLRAAMSKGLVEWVKNTNPDILCLQEIKASPEQIDMKGFESLGYHHYWYPAQKKGYSGVAIFTKQKPKSLVHGCGIKEYDDEGRVLRIDFETISVMSVYHPSGTSGEERQDFKMKWLEDFSNYVSGLKKKLPNLLLCGDFNICHRAIDIHNPKSNANSSGFLPAEQEWMEDFINSGYIDSFRHFNNEPHNYTWWSFRANARAKNLGWRIDYNLVSEKLKDKLKRAAILPEARHSDHCPVLLELDI